MFLSGSPGDLFPSTVCRRTSARGLGAIGDVDRTGGPQGESEGDANCRIIPLCTPGQEERAAVSNAHAIVLKIGHVHGCRYRSPPETRKLNWQ